MKTTLNYKGRTIEIVHDADAQSPAEWRDDAVFLVTDHRQCFIPEPGNKTRKVDFEALFEEFGETHWIFPVEAYIHSGVVLALSGTGNFPDRQWDVSMIGAIFLSKAEWPDKEKAGVAGASQLETWNMYLSGDVWGYVVENDSCWGFYGQPEAIEQAKAVIDCQLERERIARLARVKQWIINRVPLHKRAFTV